MRGSFSIHHPSPYDPCALRDATVKGPVVIAWGDCPTTIPFGHILGVLRTADPDQKEPVVLKGKTYVTPPPTLGVNNGPPPQTVWAVVFPKVSGGDYALEIWMTRADGKLGMLLGSAGPIRVAIEYEITLASPSTGASVYSPQFYAGGQDTDYLQVTSTFWNGTNSFHGVEVHRGTPTEQYWMHTFTNVTPGTGYSCVGTNGVHTTGTDTGITVMAPP